MFGRQPIEKPEHRPKEKPGEVESAFHFAGSLLSISSHSSTGSTKAPQRPLCIWASPSGSSQQQCQNVYTNRISEQPVGFFTTGRHCSKMCSISHTHTHTHTHTCKVHVMGRAFVSQVLNFAGISREPQQLALRCCSLPRTFFTAECLRIQVSRTCGPQAAHISLLGCESKLNISKPECGTCI